MMRRLLALSLISIFVSILAPTPTFPITIGFIPPLQQTSIAESVNVAVMISGLGDAMPPSLGAYDLDVTFDPNILFFKRVIFGDPTFGDQLDLFGLGSVQAVDSSVLGRVNLFELSLDSPVDLDRLQRGNFILASLGFETISLGATPLSLTINALADSMG